MRKSETMDMVHGPLLKNLFLFSLPLIASYTLQIAFNAADTKVVGKFSGADGLAAVGATTPLVNLLISLFNGIAVGANIVIANMIGRQDQNNIPRAVHTSYWLALAGGILLTALGFFLSEPMLAAISTPADIIDQSVLYMRIYFAGSLPLLIYDFGSAILRSKGDTVRPTVYLTVAGILNIILNLYTVIVLKMGVSGVAIATVISEIVSAVLVTVSLMRQSDATRLEWRQIRLDRHIFSKIMRVGIPAGIQNMMWSVSNIAVQQAMNTFGSIVVAGNSAALNLEGFVYVSMNAFTDACITFTSQAAGAQDTHQVRRVMRVTLILMTIASASMGILLTVFGNSLLLLYTNDPDVIVAGMVRMRYVVLWLWINAVLDIPAASMRGMDYSSTPTVVMMLGIVVVRLIYIATFWRAHPTLEMLYFCFPLSWVITTIAMFLFWKRSYDHFCRTYGKPIKYEG